MLHVFTVLSLFWSFYCHALDGNQVFRVESPSGSLTIVPKSWATQVKKTDSLLVKQQKANCAQLNMDKCLSFSAGMQSTGFLVKDGSTLLTSLHEFASYLRARWQVDPTYQDVQVPLLISRDGGAPIFGDQAGDRATLTLIDPSAAQLIKSDADLTGYVDQDLVYIRLNRSLGEPVTLGPLQTSGPVSSTGFSLADDVTIQTYDGQILPKPRQPYCTLGTISAWNRLQYADYVAYEGLSGGPVTNRLGQVIGLHQGTCTLPDGHEISYFVELANLLKP